jgi:CheY-like chemotaxis protein
MPDMSGREVVERVLARHPPARVLYMSGYTSDAVLRPGVPSADVAFLQKPFSAAALIGEGPRGAGPARPLSGRAHSLQSRFHQGRSSGLTSP